MRKICVGALVGLLVLSCTPKEKKEGEEGTKIMEQVTPLTLSIKEAEKIRIFLFP